MPAVRMIERRNQLVHSRLAKPGRPRLSELFRHDAVNPAPVIAAVEVDVLLDATRQRPRMLDHLAVHVGDVQRTVRPNLHLHRPKPVVRRGEKLPVALVTGALGFELNPSAPQFFSVHQIAAAVCDEGITAEPAWPGVPVVDRHAGGRREITGGTATALHRAGHLLGDTPACADHPPRLVRAQPEHRRRGTVHRDVHQRRRRTEVRIRPGIAPLVHHLLNVVAVAADELPPGSIEIHPVLSAAALEPEVECPWVEREIAAPKSNRAQLRPADCAHLSRRAAGGAVDAIVQSPAEAVHQRLHVQLGRLVAEAGEHHPPLVGSGVAVGVLQVKDVRCHADEHPAVEAGDRRWPGQVTSIDGRAIETPIAVGVLEQPHLAKPILPVLRVADHLDDEQPAVLVERHRHGIGHQRLGGGQLDAKPGLEREGAQRLGRLGRLQAGKIPLGRFRFSGCGDQPRQAKPSDNNELTTKHNPNEAAKSSNNKQKQGDNEYRHNSY